MKNHKATQPAISVGVLYSPLFWYALLHIHSTFCNHHDEEGRAGCFTFIVLRMSYYCKCPVALPCDAVSGSAVCVCVIS